MEAIRNTVSLVIAAGPARLRRPNAASMMTPSALAAAAVTPATWPDATASSNTLSIAFMLGIGRSSRLVDAAYLKSPGLPTGGQKREDRARLVAAKEHGDDHSVGKFPGVILHPILCGARDRRL